MREREEYRSLEDVKFTDQLAERERGGYCRDRQLTVVGSNRVTGYTVDGFVVCCTGVDALEIEHRGMGGRGGGRKSASLLRS